MSVGITYEEVLAEYEVLYQLFRTGRMEPFNNVYIRKAYKLGDMMPSKMSITKQFRLIRSGHRDMIPREPCPDESDYIAVITLLNSNNGNIKPYEFKIAADGSFLYRIPFEYNKQPIQKWVKYIRRWLAEFKGMEGIRAQWRCDTIKQELLEKTLLRAEWD
jgi:hypothetical protein